MTPRRFKLDETQETPAWRISLSKIGDAGGSQKNGSVIGWEYASPEKGYPYLVYLYNGGVFRTTTVQEVREIEKGIIIRTLHSTYCVEYLGMEYI